MKLSGMVEWTIMDLTFKIPLPPGTRYVNGNAPSTTTVELKGTDVIFFTSVFHKPLRGVFLTIEVTDTTKKVFDTSVLIEWKGKNPGSYSAKISFDISKEPLNWSRPPHRLNFGFFATVGDDEVIDYTIYVESLSNLRMWDLKLNIALPAGTTYLSADTPPQFSTDFDGKVIYFKVAELPSGTNLGAIHFKLSMANAPDNKPITTRIWATWKNAGQVVGWGDVLEESLTSGEVTILPHVRQYVLADWGDDVPLANYNVVSLAMQDKGTMLRVVFYLVGEVKPSEPVNFSLFIDQDCRIETGQVRDGRGVEYRLLYQPEFGQAKFIPLDMRQDRWLNAEATSIAAQIEGKTVAMLVPFSLLGNQRQFCWTGLARNETKKYTPDPPSEKIPDLYLPTLSQYQTTVKAELAAQLDEALAEKKMSLVPLGAPTQVEPTASPEKKSADDPKSTPTVKPNKPTVAPNKPGNLQQGENEKTAVEDKFIKLGDIWQYQPGWTAPPPDWTKREFDDSKWYSGATSIGYGDGKFTTDLSLSLSQIQQVEASNTEKPANPPKALPGGPPLTDFASVFMRRAFAVDQPANLTKLTLRIDYEDGFVVYINGVEAARRGLKEPNTPLLFNAPATKRHSGAFEEVDLSHLIPKLIGGQNLMAIEVHRSLERSNIFIAPELTWERGAKAKLTATPEKLDQEKDTQPTPTATPLPQPTAAAPDIIEPEPTKKVAPTAPKVAEAEKPMPTSKAGPAATVQPSTEKTEKVEKTEKKTEQAKPNPPAGDGSIYVPEMGAPVPQAPSAASTPPPVDSQTLPPLPIVPMPKVDFAPPNPNPSIIDTHGKIAIPVDNGHGFYDIHIYALRFGYGWETKVVEKARQPHLRPDGQRMLMRHQGGGHDAIFEYNFIDGTEQAVSEHRLDSHPFYDPWGNRVTYDNPALVVDPKGVAHAHLAVQCGLKVPNQESDPRCKNIPSFGIIVPSGQMGPIEGQRPLWANNDMIIYQGCNTWLSGSACGIYAVGSWSTKGFSDGSIPTALTHDTSDMPGDTKGDYIVFMSHRDGNWEIYVMGLDGKGVRNLSQNPQSNDGLPTISPDGSWVGFVSDRGGQWAVWAVPLAGGRAEKLFDFPNHTPWSTGERDWTNERISWGP